VSILHEPLARRFAVPYDANMCSITTVADELANAVAAVHAVDRASLSGAEVTELFVAVDEAWSRLGAVRARLAAAVDDRRVWADDGSRSCAAFIARRRNCSRSSAATAIRLGHALDRMPEVATDAAAGLLGADQLRELAACQRFAPEAFAEAEATLVDHARSLGYQDFVRVAAAWRAAADAVAAERDADRVHQRRHLIWHRRPDGTLQIQSGELDPIGAEAFLSELERLEQQLFDADWADATERCNGDVRNSHLPRTPAQRRADALVEMAHRSRTAPADGIRPEPLVTVYVDYETVTGRLCELASGAPITPGRLLPLFTRADIERIVFGPRKRVLELGVRTRFFTGGLRRAIELRDRHCQWPGCNVPASRCQIDHDQPYAAGGLTTQDNGTVRCGPHNRRRVHHPEPPPVDPEAAWYQRQTRRRIRALIAQPRPSPGAATG
jgi:hypothetical protein